MASSIVVVLQYRSDGHPRQLGTYCQRLKAIEEILKQYSASVNSAQERDRELKASPQLVRAEVTFDDTSKREAKTEADRQQGTQNSISRAAWCAFGAAILYAAISYNQLYEMRMQTAEVFHQSEVENASASGQNAQLFRQLNIAQQQANATQEQVTAVQRQTRQDQRAWIKLQHQGPVAVEEGKPLGVTVEFTNIGKTPARKVLTQAVIERLEKDQAPSLSYNKPHNNATVGVIFPNEQSQFAAYWEKSIAKGSILAEHYVVSGDDVLRFSKGQIYFALYARTSYVDIFGKNHLSTFCQFFVQPIPNAYMHAQKCSDYNGVDNNE